MTNGSSKNTKFFQCLRPKFCLPTQVFKLSGGRIIIIWDLYSLVLCALQRCYTNGNIDHLKRLLAWFMRNGAAAFTINYSWITNCPHYYERLLFSLLDLHNYVSLKQTFYFLQPINQNVYYRYRLYRILNIYHTGCYNMCGFQLSWRRRWQQQRRGGKGYIAELFRFYFIWMALTSTAHKI